MSTFSGLNTAYTGLASAKLGFDVVGQNVANASTAGYTRQRVTTSAVAPLNSAGLFSSGVRPGQGVSIDGIARLGNSALDAQVRSTAGDAGYTAVRANVMTALETSLNEPGANGIASQLGNFWAAWGDLSNNADESAQGGLVIGAAKTLASSIATGYQSVASQWTTARSDIAGMVDEVNATAAQVADLNGRIRSTLAAGNSANELLDARNMMTTTLAALTGGTVRELPDGTVDVLVGGNPLVTGTISQELKLTGSLTFAGSAAAPVQVEWARRPGVPVAVDGGEIGGSLTMLAPANAQGTGGALAEAAASYNALATALTAQVNDIHRTGATAAGVTNLNFFVPIDPTNASPAALSLSVVPTSQADIASATPGAGGKDGSIADAIAQIGVAAGSPNKLWSASVTAIAVESKTTLKQAVLADIATTAAVNSQQSNAAVDLDEENISLLTYQHAYQGAARVITAIDEMLDTLINRTGLVGR